MTENHTAIVIGAGPAGLAVSALLHHRGIDHRVLESRNQVGGTYSRLWHGLKLLSPPSMSHLPLHRCDHASRQINAGEYAEYLQGYAQRLPIQLNTTVKQVTKDQLNYNVVLSDQRQLSAKYIIVATGMSDFPNALPDTMINEATIPIQYAMQFQGPSEYAGKNVLVVGSGTSAYEIATLLADTANVWLATHGLRKSVPLYLAGINFHYLIRWIEYLPLFLLKRVCSPTWHEPPISIGIEKQVKDGRIQIIDPRCHITQNQLTQDDEKNVRLDVIINATGYSHTAAFLPADIAKTPRGDIATHHNQSISHQGLFIIGAPCSGGIDSPFLRGIRRDAGRIVDNIEKMENRP